MTLNKYDKASEWSYLEFLYPRIHIKGIQFFFYFNRDMAFFTQ